MKKNTESAPPWARFTSLLSHFEDRLSGPRINDSRLPALTLAALARFPPIPRRGWLRLSLFLRGCTSNGHCLRPLLCGGDRHAPNLLRRSAPLAPLHGRGPSRR